MDALESLIFLKQWYADNKGILGDQTSQVSAIRADRNIENIIRDLYTRIYCKHLGGCGSCLADAFCVLLHFPNEKMLEIMECNFKLKQGVLLMDSNGKLPITTHANITDEIAIAYLKDNIGRLDLFEKVPENLDELLHPKEVEEAPAETPTDTPVEETAEAPAEAPVKKNRKKKTT